VQNVVYNNNFFINILEMIQRTWSW